MIVVKKKTHNAEQEEIVESTVGSFYARSNCKDNHNNFRSEIRIRTANSIRRNEPTMRIRIHLGEISNYY